MPWSSSRLRPVVIADDGRGADRVTDKDRLKDHRDIHQNAASGDTVLSRICHQAGVIEHSDKRHRDVAHQLGRAVRTHLPECRKIEAAPAEFQHTRVLLRKIDKGNDTADRPAQGGGNRGTRHAPRKDSDEERVKYHIGHARRYHHKESEFRLPRRGEQALEFILKNIEREGEQNDPPYSTHASSISPSAPSRRAMGRRKITPSTARRTPRAIEV